jgi:hypothetical protein
MRYEPLREAPAARRSLPTFWVAAGLAVLVALAALSMALR